MNRKAFFDSCRATVMGPTIEPNEVKGAEVILDAMAGCPISWTAYALATAWHETANEMLPIKERGGPAYFFRMYDPKGQRPNVAARLGNTITGDGVKFAGRGYVQLTGRANYAKAGDKIGVDLLGNPELAMDEANAAKIMRAGMTGGWFTGRHFANYLPQSGLADRGQMIGARRIINGTDCDMAIAAYALKFQDALRAGNWS